MYEEVLCFAGCSQSVCAVPEMTDSLPKPPKSPKPPSQSTGGAGTKPKSERGLGGRRVIVLSLGPANLHGKVSPFLPLPGEGRELQCLPGAACLCPDTTRGVSVTHQTHRSEWICKQRHYRASGSAIVHCLVELLGFTPSLGRADSDGVPNQMVAVANVDAVGC